MVRRFVDLDGRRVKKTPRDYPYSYDPFVIYKGDDLNIEEDDSFYSDRLSLWYDCERMRELKEKYSIEHGDYFWAYNPIEKLDKFLSDLMRISAKITAIVQYCNISNGYPYWLVYYRREDVVSGE